MKLTINKKEEINIEVGDFFIVQDRGDRPEIRQIVYYHGDYIALDVEIGREGFVADSIEELVEKYKNNFDIVTPVKKSEVELVVGGR